MHVEMDVNSYLNGQEAIEQLHKEVDFLRGRADSIKKAMDLLALVMDEHSNIKIAFHRLGNDRLALRQRATILSERNL
jgi:hypothetical protein